MTKRKNPGDNQVGYGKPPKHSQFKKGQVANPNGRPKGSGGLSPIDKALNRWVTLIEDGKRRKVPATEAVITQTVNDALKGDKTARRDVARLAMQRETARRNITGPVAPSPDNSPMLPRIVISTYIGKTMKRLGITVEPNQVQKLRSWVVIAALEQMTAEERAEFSLADLIHEVENPGELEMYLSGL
jgi:hypothetical protein